LSKITAYGSLSTPQPDDVLPIVDVHDTTMASTGTTKKITAGNLLAQLLPSGDTTGAGDAATINAAVAALPAGGGVITLQPGTWYLVPGAVTISAAKPVSVFAAGVRINAVSGTAGDVLRIYDSSTYSGRTYQGGGIFGFPVIDGTNAAAGSAGLHMGDIFQYHADVSVQNFSGAGDIGVHFDNEYYWTEQLTGKIYAQNCTSHVVFDHGSAHATCTGSYDRANLSIDVDATSATQDGVVFQAGTYITDGQLTYGGNFVTQSASTSAAVLRITGTAPGGTADAGTVSQLNSSRVDVGVECDVVTGSNAAYTVYFGSSSNLIFNCYGSLDFGASATDFQSSNASQGAITFSGPIRGLAGGSLRGSLAAPLATYKSGSWIQGVYNVSTSSSLGNGTLRVSPWVVTRPVLISAIGAEFSAAGDAASVFAVSLYADDGTGWPGALLSSPGSISTGTGNAGTVSTGGTPGLYTVSLPTPMLILPGTYWPGGVIQGVTTTQPTMRTGSFGPQFPICTDGNPGADSLLAGVTNTGVTSTLPGTFAAFGTAGGAGSVPRMVLVLN